MFPDIRFGGELRPSQASAVAAVRQDLARGSRRLHIVAPPGSGKTILGLYLWVTEVRRPALVLSPNSAIQAQWVARLDLFEGVRREHTSTDPAAPALLTSLTYQAVTLPVREDEALDRAAIECWIERLVSEGEAADPDEARVWIDDLSRHNPGYHAERLARYRKFVRDERARQGEALGILHASSRATLERLRARGVGCVVLDECHHLVGHWGRVLDAVATLFDDPVIIGLTATPPDLGGEHERDVERYGRLLGPVDYEVPVPAVVKDGFLAPYQDLVRFVRPTAQELQFVARADEALFALVEELCAPGETTESLVEWVSAVLRERRLPTGSLDSWASFARRDPGLADAGRWFLMSRRVPFPDGVPPLAAGLEEPPPLEVLAPVLDRYVRHRLRCSPAPSDHVIAERTTDRLRILGVQITETGARACASPVSRVLAYSRSKVEAIREILLAERAVLGDRLRAVVVTDYEKTSAVSAEIRDLLDEEAGGAIAAFRALVADPETDALDPVLVTGSSLFADDDLAPRLDDEASRWLREQGVDVELLFSEEAGFHVISAQGSAWSPRVYVELVTELFQKGITRCLVGTRGLLGEGWDATRVNVLVDLTTVTTSMSVNQLRGRSIRLDRTDPEKVADNWDVVAIAPELAKGLDDYRRFLDKHRVLLGVTDDGVVEQGAGHVHPAFTEIRPEGIEESSAALNAEMLARVASRPRARALWKIGEPYRGESLQTVELGPGGGGSGFPPFGRSRDPWSDASLAYAIGEAVLGALAEAGLVGSRATHHTRERAGGYVRTFLENASPDGAEVFARSVAEVFGPLDRPRYVIPRSVEIREPTWLSRVLPSVVGRYFERRRQEFRSLHAVPTALAQNRTLAAMFERHWNRTVSPGKAVYAHRGEGERLLEQALASNTVSVRRIHQKSVFH